MKFKIETWDKNQILRKISDPVLKSEYRKYAQIWDEMIKFIKNPANNWVWMAAPQVWINKRLICISLLKDYDDETFKTILMMNPELIECSKEFAVDNEWCLSMPKIFWDVSRYSKIKVKYIDNRWKENILSLDWIPSRIVQHEIDHLNGILFVDKVIKEEDLNSEHHVL